MNGRKNGLLNITACILFLLCLPLAAFAETDTQRGFVMPPVEAFIAKWNPSGGSELGSSQSFLIELCALLNVPRPESPRSSLQDNSYLFEAAVPITGPDGKTTTGRIDLYKKGCFIWESKQGSDKPAPGEKGPRRQGTALRGTQGWDRAMIAAKAQAEGYARGLPAKDGRPPFILVADIGFVVEVYADFRDTGIYTPFPSARDYRITLEDFRKTEVQERLRAIWTDPLSLDPTRESAKVTQALAVKLAGLAKSLEDGGQSPDDVSQFLMRCIFTMFAEDVDLLPYDSFSQMLENLQNTPEGFAAAATDLWTTMQTGGQSSSLGRQVLNFRGYLFQDAKALPLDKKQITLLLEAARANWSAVEPGIFGTLLEKALSPRERHKLGAHYTPPAYVERLVVPTIIEPLREEWDSVKGSALAHVMSGDHQAATAEIEAFHQRLCAVIVLDPSCGSGNFLTASMELMKELEGEIIQALRDLGQSERQLAAKGIAVGPHQFRGIEVVRRAADVSELVLWISYLQKHYAIHGRVNPVEPILQDYRSIECRDALVTWNADGSARRADPWPKSDYIIGNPPFIGSQRMRSALGDEYTESLRKIYVELPGNVDYVMYWWSTAANLLQKGEIRQFGLITTNKIRQTNNQRVVESYLSATPPISFVYAIPDHPWMDDSQKEGRGRVSMGVCAQGKHPGVLAEVILERREGNFVRVNLQNDVGTINSKLSLGPSTAGAQALKANQNIASRGMELRGSGFIVTEKEAQELGLHSISGLENYIRPYRNGQDIAGISRNLMVIDLFGLKSEEVKRRYPAVYQWILDKVKPERETNRREASRKNWWIFGEARATFRPALEGLSRYIATPETARRRYFVFLDKSVLPDNKLVAVASDDAYVLGILSSRIHTEWALATGGRLGIGNDLVYVKSQCFDAFPFPDAADQQKARIRALAEAIDAHRKQRQALYSELTLSDMYACLEQMVWGVNLTQWETTTSQKGDLAVLMKLHNDLDGAVAEAYGWSGDLSTEEILARLLELNRQRTQEEKAGKVRWLRPSYQNPVKQ